SQKNVGIELAYRRFHTGDQCGGRARGAQCKAGERTRRSSLTRTGRFSLTPRNEGERGEFIPQGSVFRVFHYSDDLNRAAEFIAFPNAIVAPQRIRWAEISLGHRLTDDGDTRRTGRVAA